MKAVLAFAIGALLAVQARAETVTIPSDVQLHKRASNRSRTVLEIPAGETAEIIVWKRGWIKVRVRGRVGWIPQVSILEEVPATEPTPEATSEPEDVAAAEPAFDPLANEPPVLQIDQIVTDGATPRALELAVGAGVTVITQGFRAMTDSYNLDATAATFSIAGGYRHRAGTDSVVVVEASYAYAQAQSAYTIHDASAQLAFGHEIARGWLLLARAGARYHSFQVAHVNDAAMNPSGIPSEIQIAPTFGAAVEISPTERFGLRIVLDAFGPFTDVTQTANLAKGETPRASGIATQAAFTYHVRPMLDVRASYDLGVTAIDFGEAAERVDINQTLTLGLAKGF